MAKYACPRCIYSTQVSSKLTGHYERTRHDRVPKQWKGGMTTLGSKPKSKAKK